MVSSPRLSRMAARRPTWRESAGIIVGAAALFLFGAFAAMLATEFRDAEVIAFIAIPVAPLLVLVTVMNPLVGVIGIVATFPIGSEAAPVGVLQIQAVEVAVFLSALIVMIRRLSVGTTPLPFVAPLGWALALLAWVFVSFFAALDKTLALKTMFTLFGGIVAAMVIIAACRRTADVRLVMAAIVLVAAGIAITTLPSLGEIETGYGGAYISKGRTEGAFTHPNQLGAWFALAVPLAAALVLSTRSRRVQLLMGASLVTILIGLMATLSRGAWIGSALAALLLLARLKEARRMLLAFAIPTLVVGYFAWSLTPDAAAEFEVVGERARSLTVRSPHDDRDVIYREAIREIREEPLFGQGPGSFPVASRRSVSESATLSYEHAHNLYLNWGAESGLIAIVLIVAFVISLIVTAARASTRARVRGDPSTRILIIGLAASLLTVVAQGFFDYVVGNPVMHTAVWIVIGSLLVVAHPAARRAAV
jgi:putative inorganic carbon (hco3(-)) transporter